MPTTENEVASLVAPLIVLRVSPPEEYLQKASINSPLLSAASLLLSLACSLFSPPAYIQEDFDKVSYSIDNPEIDTTGVITGDTTGGDTTSSNVAAANPANLDLDSVDSL